MRNTSITPIENACAILGGQIHLAELLGLSPAAINQWVHGLRPVPPQHCPAIEKATEGAVTRKDLRPDDWQLIWPELTEKEPADHIRRSTDQEAQQ